MEKLQVPHDLLVTSLSAKLQVIVGHFNFACRVVAPGRAFLRHLCDVMVGLRSPLYKVKVMVWIQFLNYFNGVSLWWEIQLVEAELQSIQILLEVLV